MRIVHQGKNTQWSDEAKLTTPEFKGCCVWKECPDNVDERRKYSVDGENPRITTNLGYGYCCTIIGNTPLPLNKVTSWSVKILKSKWNDGNGLNIGVAPSDIDQNEDLNYNKCGWYFYCYLSDCVLDLLTNTTKKSMVQGKEMGNMCTQETVLVL